MPTLRSAAAAACFALLVAVPMTSQAQVADSTKTDAEDFVHDVLHAILGPHLNVFASGGWTTSDRFLLQRAANTVDGERGLQSSGGYNIGGGVGTDILLRMGFRASYTYSSADLDFKTDDGTGSHALDINNVGRLKQQTLTLEVMRYMLPARAAITPYGTLGIQGTWSSLDAKSALLTSNGETPFTISPLFSFGLQFRVASHWAGRAEATLMSGHNPFAGNKSFRAFSGPTIDEPDGANRTDFRIGGVYYFNKPPKLPKVVR